MLVHYVEEVVPLDCTARGGQRFVVTSTHNRHTTLLTELIDEYDSLSLGVVSKLDSLQERLRLLDSEQSLVPCSEVEPECDCVLVMTFLGNTQRVRPLGCPLHVPGE